MEKSEMMKRYEAENGKSARGELYSGSIKLYMPTNNYIAWLEAQLTWRPVSEKPEKAGVYFIEGKPYTGCEYKIITTAYFNGESFLWHAVVRWLPIPPAPDTVPDGWETKGDNDEEVFLDSQDCSLLHLDRQIYMGILGPAWYQGQALVDDYYPGYRPIEALKEDWSYI